MNEKNIQEFYHEQVSEVARAKANARKREDMIDGLLRTIDYAQDYLPVTVVTMERFRESSFTHSPRRPFLSSEVAYKLGGVDGTPFFSWHGKLFIPQNRLEVVVLSVKEILEKDISEDMVNGLLANIGMFVGLDRAPEVHACGFFIFRYFLPAGPDKKQRKRLHVPISEQSLEKAVASLLNRENLGIELERAERIEVYYASRWTHVEKMPPSGDIASARVLGRTAMNLEVQE